MRWLMIVLLLCSVSFGGIISPPQPSSGIDSEKVYDCFLFFNELELLEIRLNELYDVVDKFVIVEAAEGFRGHTKSFNFENAQERYTKFADKIIYIKLHERIDTDNPWVREYWQRDQIMRGLTECSPEDLIMISDVDEFIPAPMIQALRRESDRYPMIGFVQEMYRWFLNRSAQEKWSGTAALRYKHLAATTPQQIRHRVRTGQMTLWHCGWHFTSMGGYDRIVEKYRNFSHGSDDVLSYEAWKGQVQSHPLVEIDASFPKYVQENVPYLIEIGMIDAG